MCIAVTYVCEFANRAPGGGGAQLWLDKCQKAGNLSFLIGRITGLLQMKNWSSKLMPDEEFKILSDFARQLFT